MLTITKFKLTVSCWTSSSPKPPVPEQKKTGMNRRLGPSLQIFLYTILILDQHGLSSLSAIINDSVWHQVDGFVQGHGVPPSYCCGFSINNGHELGWFFGATPWPWTKLQRQVRNAGTATWARQDQSVLLIFIMENHQYSIINQISTNLVFNTNKKREVSTKLVDSWLIMQSS